MRGWDERRARTTARPAFAFLGAFFFIAALTVLPDAASAACSTNTPLNGDTVTCTGSDSVGVGNGTQDNVTVTVQPGADISVGAGATAISLQDTNTVTNNGTINAGFFGNGIFVSNGNTVTNNGTVTVGIGGVGIDVLNGNLVFNSGGITAGDGGIGINLCCDNTVTSSGRITIGDGGFGIFSAGGVGNAITNSGTISVGVASFGIAAFDGFISPTLNATIANSGTIEAGNFGAGIAVVQNYNVNNTGTIVVGGGGRGITANFDGNVISNSGTIRTGAGGSGIEALGSNNTVNNTGTITAGSGGIGVQFGGNDNTLNNFGTIRTSGAGISFDACFCTTNNVVNNFGTLDGTVTMVDTATFSHTLNNSGLITISDSLAGTPFAFHGVDGLFNQTSTGILELRVNNTTNGNDVLYANTATIAGTLRVAPQSGLYEAVTTYANVFTTTNAVGTPFNSYTSTSPFFSVMPTYDSGDPNAYTAISLTLTLIPFGEVPGLTDNQRAVGNALQSVYSTGLTGDAATFFSNLFGATSVSVYDQLSGQGTAATQGAAFQSGGMFMSLFGQGPFGIGGTGNTAGPLGYAAADRHPADDIIKVRAQDEIARRWQLWANGFGGRRTIDGDTSTGTLGSSQNTAGGAGGLIYWVDPDFAIGAAVGASESRFSVDDLATSGDLTGAHFGLHAAKRWGAFYATGAIAYSHYSNDTTRTIAGVGPTETATGSFGSDQLSGRLELGWRHERGAFAVTPFAALQVSQLWQQGYSETSITSSGAPGILGLSYASQTVTSLPATLGVQVDSRIDLGAGRTLTPYARLAWVHEFEPDTRITASFLTLPGASFSVDGARIASDSARIDSGLRLALGEGLALKAGFTGEFSQTSRSYAGTGGLQVTW